MEASLWIFFVFLIYFAILIGIAILRARHMDGMTDYVLAGRKLGSVTSALSSASSATSGWTMLVFPALAFAAGMMHLWTVVGIILGAWLAWTLLAKRLRRYTIATGDSLTILSSWKSVQRHERDAARDFGHHHAVLHDAVCMLRPDCRRQTA